MPEVHIVGEVQGASGVERKNNVYCKFKVITENDKWFVLEGESRGQTQLSLAEKFNEDVVVWNHPIDVYYATSVIQGWPKINVEVWFEDKFGSHELGK